MKPNMSAQTRKLTRVLRPLGRAEARRATAAAVEHLRPELTRDGRTRFRVLGAQLYLTRPAGKGTLGRLVDVRLLDSLSRRHLRVVVAGGRVVEVRTLDWQPAFAAGEIADAVALAARDQRLRTIVSRRGVFASPFSPGGNAPGERRIGLRYLIRRGPVAALVAEAEVDLIEQRVTAAQPVTGGFHGELR
jgi:hypothetical protein